MYCNVSNKYRKLKKTKILFSFIKVYKALSLSIIYIKCGHEYEKIFKSSNLNVLIINNYVLHNKRNINIRKKKFSDYKRFQEALHLTQKNNLIDTNGGVYLTVDSLIEINNLIISSNDIILRKVNKNHIYWENVYV